MIRNIKEQRFPKITTVVDGVWMCIKTFAYVIILSPVILSCSFSDDIATTALVETEETEDIAIPIIITDNGNPMKVHRDYGDEDAITEANFYFYDEDGHFITRGEIDDNTDNDLSTSNLVILKGLKDTSYPKYVVVVANLPDGITYTYNLADMQDIVSPGTSSGIYGSHDNFIMTSSTYLDASENYNFVKEISPSDFVNANDAEAVANATPIQIPVERLAAKVTVTLSLDDVENKTSISGHSNVFKVHSNPDYYVDLLGWKINAIARDTYMFKNLDENWDTTNPWTDWNDNTNTRCYWAKSYYYAEGSADDYPLNNKRTVTDTTTGDVTQVENTSSDEADASTWLNPYVEYVDLNSGLKSFIQSAYCPENTNTAGSEGIIKNAKSTAITSVLIKAQGLDADGNPLSDLLENEKGYMYYNIPIKHHTAELHSSIQEGDYGVVRNHSYTIKITGVNNLGTAYDDENAVVVPVDEAALTFTTLSGLWSSTEEDVYISAGDFDLTIEDE